MTLSKQIFGVISASVISFAGYYYYCQISKKEDPNEINEVLFFSEGDPIVRKSKHSRCMITLSSDKLFQYLNRSKQTLDICMYVLTNQDLTNMLLKLNHKSVNIRIIIDSVMAYSSGSTIRRLEKQGIEVRWIKSANFMHHKFCIIDALDEEGTPIVISGSLNWTNQALFGNYENVIVSSHKSLVEQYRVEFERLWVLFKPIA